MSRDGAPVVPAARPQSYFGRPVLKPVPWEPHWIGTYLFTGGLGGASLALAAAARARGENRLARSALIAAMAGLGVSPPLLIADLGRRARFHHMLRVAKPRSPMSVGTWLLTGAGLAGGVAAAAELGPDLPLGPGRALARGLRPAARVAEPAAGVLGLGVATYTGVLLADTAVPAWSHARHHLPVLFAASAAASAGAAAAALTPVAAAGPARRLAVTGVAAEVAVAAAMERSLPAAVARAHHQGTAAHLGRAARALSLGGAALLLVAGRRRAGAIVGGTLVLGGSLCERLSVLEAGRGSAADPEATVGPQRARLAAAGGAG